MTLHENRRTTHNLTNLEHPPSSRIRAPNTVLLWVMSAIVILMIGAATGWAAGKVFSPETSAVTPKAFTFAKVSDGEVGSSITLNATAAWTPTPEGVNRATGVVTTVNVSPGQVVGQGATLYTVNQRPVVIAQGEIPAFEVLDQGTKGVDVTQLQKMLASKGFFRGAADGNLGASTVTAVKQWQKRMGLAQDGLVQPADIVFVPILPTRVTLDYTIVKRGAMLTGNELVVETLPESPTFTLPASGTQAALISAGTRVEITDGNLKWNARATDHLTDANGDVSISLEAASDEAICGTDCARIPVAGHTSLLATVITVEPQTGLVVPSAALLSGASGQISVIDGRGKSHAVTIRASSRGMSLIDGVTAGMRVRVPASAG